MFFRLHSASLYKTQQPDHKNYIITIHTPNELKSTQQKTDFNTLRAYLIQDTDRQFFWLQHFGYIPQWLRIKPPIFSWFDLLCKTTMEIIGNFTPSATAEPSLTRPPKANTHSLTRLTEIVPLWIIKPPASSPTATMPLARGAMQ